MPDTAPEGTSPVNRARIGKILFLITEDWFVLSHFKPLITTLVDLGADVAIATRVGDRLDDVRRLGVRVIPFDYHRGPARPHVDGLTLARLTALLRRERPDVIHAIALKPIVIGSVAARLAGVPRIAMHLTGLGYAGTAADSQAPLIVRVALQIIASTMRRPGTWLFVENPDDVKRLEGFAALNAARVTELGGAGVDPAHYPFTPVPASGRPHAGFVGRMVWTKGVDLLVAAHDAVRARDVDLATTLCGTPDPSNPKSVPEATLADWARRPGLSCLGRVDDIAGFWRDTTFAVVPSRGGEGLPRALLEAAACGRAIVTTAVAGCRHFVRDGIEGLVVPPEDADALAEAIYKLAQDRDLAARMGAAARQRVLQGYTEAHVKQSITAAYARLMA